MFLCPLVDFLSQDSHLFDGFIGKLQGQVLRFEEFLVLFHQSVLGFSENTDEIIPRKG